MTTDDPGRLRIDDRHAVPVSEITWTFGASGGPGGQHANTSNTRAELRFDITRSTAFSEPERDRLLDRLGPIVRIAASDERSQWRNRELALERLADRLAAGLRRRPSRTPTRPTRASKERRLEEKRRRATTKQSRRPQGDE